MITYAFIKVEVVKVIIIITMASKYTAVGLAAFVYSF